MRKLLPVIMMIIMLVLSLQASAASMEMPLPPEAGSALADESMGEVEEARLRSLHVDPVVIPEPSTMALMAVGMMSLIIRRRQVAMLQAESRRQAAKQEQQVDQPMQVEPTNTA